MSLNCIKISQPEEGKLESLVKELTALGLVEDLDFVLLDVDGGEFLLDFIPEAEEKVKSKLISEGLSTLKGLLN